MAMALQTALQMAMLAAIGGAALAQEKPLPAVENLRVEYFSSPLAVGSATPRFSWELPAGLPRGVGQQSYQITVIRPYTDFAPIWSSGLVDSDSTHGIVCNHTLSANAMYQVIVRWVSTDGGNSENAATTFGVGPMDAKDWGTAQWIGSQSQRQIRASFTLNETHSDILYAVLHVAAPGCAVVTVNGKPVDPGVGICTWTQFQHSVLYSSLDVSSALVAGENVIGLLLGHNMFGDSKGAESEPTVMVKLNVGAKPHPAPPGAHAYLYTVVSEGGDPLPPAPAPPGPTPQPKGGCGGHAAGGACLCAIIDEHQNVTLGCEGGSKISSITFASFGTPSGTCDGGTNPSGDTFKKNVKCDAPEALAEIEKACVGKESCTLMPTCGHPDGDGGKACELFADSEGGGLVPDPCRMVPKHLNVAIDCSSDDATVPAIPPPGGGGAITETVIASKWQAIDSYIISDDPWNGCTTDWTKAGDRQGWDTVEFPADKLADWSPAARSGTLLVSQLPTPRVSAIPPTAVIRTLTPVSVDKLDNGDFVYTFPENFVGVAQVQPGHVTGSEGSLTLQHSEMRTNGTKPGFNQDPKAPIDQNWAWNEQKDTHIFGSPDENSRAVTDRPLTPIFTWHGGQFVQVHADGVTFSGKLDALVGLVTHSNLTQTGSLLFEGGDEAEALSKLQGIILNSQTSNVAAGTPTDCPTREKHGWLGDAQVTAEEAMQNFDMVSVYEEFLNMIEDTQHPDDGDVAPVAPVPVKFKKGPDEQKFLRAASLLPRLGKSGAMADLSWTAAFPLITSWLYKYYGDTYPIVKHWDSLKKYMDGVHDQASSNPGGLPAFWTWGDWCAVEARAIATPATGPELAAFNYILALDAMVTMADAVGKAEDAAKYKALGASMRVAFKTAFYNTTLERYAPDGSEAGNELLLQSLNVAPLAMAGSRPDVAASLGVDGLVSKLHEDIVKQDYHLTVGSVGAKHLLPQLSANGLHEDAMKIATQQTYPSYGWWIANGATTCWENYEGWPDPEHPPTPTHNHIFLCGGAGEWMYRSVLGIEPAAAGWKKITVRPLILASGPASVSGSMATILGKLSVAWARADTGGENMAFPAAAKLDVTIPPGATATVTVPCSDCAKTTITESGQTVWANGKFVEGVKGVSEPKEQRLDGVTFEIESGTYAFAQ